MKIQPTKKRVLLKKIKRENASIIITNKDPEVDFIVEGIGHEVKEVIIGNKVMIISHRTFRIEDSDLCLCEEDDILAIFLDEDEPIKAPPCCC